MLCVFFFNDTATTEIYTLSLHDALPISAGAVALARRKNGGWPLLHLSLSTSLYSLRLLADTWTVGLLYSPPQPAWQKLLNVDRKSTRLNSSHANISYAVFCF